MKKLWEMPVLETIGVEETAHGKSGAGRDGYYLDSNNALVQGFTSGPEYTGEIGGEITGPYIPVEP